MANNKLIIFSDMYEMDAAYKNGAKAARENIPYSQNPHRYGSQRNDQWSSGHSNEFACEHMRLGVDVIMAKNKSIVFEEDPSIIRDVHGNACEEQYRTLLQSTQSPSAVSLA